MMLVRFSTWGPMSLGTPQFSQTNGWFLEVKPVQRDPSKRWPIILRLLLLVPRGSMYSIFTHMHHRNQRNVCKYTSPMDSMAYWSIVSFFFICSKVSVSIFLTFFPHMHIFPPIPVTTLATFLEPSGAPVPGEWLQSLKLREGTEFPTVSS